MEFLEILYAIFFFMTAVEICLSHPATALMMDKRLRNTPP